MAETPEIQLAYLGFHLVSPSQALRPYVLSYWHCRRDTPLQSLHEEYMHPSGGFGVVFNFGDGVCLDGHEVAEPIFLDGTMTFSRKMGFAGRVESLGIRFRAGGAYPVLGIPLAELRNEIALLDVLDRGELLRLYAQLYEATSMQARIILLETWLLQRLTRGRERSALLAATLRQVRSSVAQVSIPRLARDFAISQRQLERLYQCHVGMSPKQYAQLLRVEAARLALKELREPTTADLAAELGFYDQAHFIRSFSAIVGMTPYAYLKRSRTSS